MESSDSISCAKCVLKCAFESQETGQTAQAHVRHKPFVKGSRNTTDSRELIADERSSADDAPGNDGHGEALLDEVSQGEEVHSHRFQLDIGKCHGPVRWATRAKRRYAN